MNQSNNYTIIKTRQSGNRLQYGVTKLTAAFRQPYSGIIAVCLLLSATVFAQPLPQALKITRLTDNFYVYTSYGSYHGQRIPANGMYVVTGKGALLFDTPWDSTQFMPLLDSIRSRHHQPVVMCIATHFHEDRTGGLAFYRRHGIPTFTSRLTDSMSRERHMNRAEHMFSKDSSFQIGQYRFETYYPGPGHAPDNIVIWFPQQQVLYGGCLVKSAHDTDLGNLSDGSLLHYAAAIKNVAVKCSTAKFIVTGHGDWSDTNSLAHTYQLAEDTMRKNR